MERIVNMNPCTCRDWATTHLQDMLVTGHHERCPHRPDLGEAYRKIIEELTKAIQYWAKDCDGIPSYAEPSYVKAKGILLQPVKWSDHE